MLKIIMALSTLTFCMASQAEVILGKFVMTEGKCSHTIVNKLSGDILTLTGADDEGQFTRKYERTSNSPKQFDAVDGFGGNVRYVSADSLVVTQADLGLTCSYKRQD